MFCPPKLAYTRKEKCISLCKKTYLITEKGALKNLYTYNIHVLLIKLILCTKIKIKFLIPTQS